MFNLLNQTKMKEFYEKQLAEYSKLYYDKLKENDELKTTLYLVFSSFILTTLILSVIIMALV